MGHKIFEEIMVKKKLTKFGLKKTYRSEKFRDLLSKTG